MPGPDFVYAVYSAGADTSNLVTPVLTPTPVNGDVLLVKLSTWDTGNPSGASSGGGQVYSTRVTAAPGGFNGYARIDTTTIAGSPAPFAVTSGGTAANSRHSMVVEHYLAANGHSLAAVPAVGSGSGVGLPSVNINTVGTNSTVSWVSVDVISADPVARAYLLSATEDGLFDGHVGANSVQYFAWAGVGAPGVYAMGMSAPGGQFWVLAGVEVLNTPIVAGANQILVVPQPPRRRDLRQPIIVTGIGAPPSPPTPADVEWCAQTPITGWTVQSPFTDWEADTPLTNWMVITPEEDC